MKNIKKIVAGSITILSLLAINPIGASAEWRQDSSGWWYAEGNSWATGWREIDGNWYYFCADGYMAHDVWMGNYYLNSDGSWNENKADDLYSKSYILGDAYFSNSHEKGYLFETKSNGLLNKNNEYHFEFYSKRTGQKVDGCYVNKDTGSTRSDIYG